MSTPDPTTPDPERTDLLEALRTHRYLFLHTVDGLTDEQADQRTTVSELTLGGLVKHVTAMQTQWCDFIERGPSAMQGEDGQEWASGFRMGPDDTLDALVEQFHQVADRTDSMCREQVRKDPRHGAAVLHHVRDAGR